MQIIRGKLPGALKICVYGPEGIGKTTLAAQFPKPLFIDTEGSTAHLDVPRLPRPASWAELLNEVDWCAANTAELQTLVIDTADWAEQLCIQAVCARAQKSGIEDFAYGKGYVYVQEEFGKLLNKLEQLRASGIHVLITAHAKMRKFEQPDEMGSYDRWEMKLTRQTAPMLKEWVDALLFANFKTLVITTKDGKHKPQGGARILYTSHSPCWDAKNRFNLPEELPLDYTQLAPLFFPTQAQSQETQVQSQAQQAQQAQTPPQRPREAPPTPVNDSASTARPDILRGDPALWEGIPEALAKLMREANVQPEEIMYVVEQKGYFPKGTPIRNYDPDFIQGWAIAYWDKLTAAIIENRKTPF